MTPNTSSKSLRADASSGAFSESSASRRSLLSEYWELTKPRLSLLSVITAVVGYVSANPSKDLGTLFCLLLGTSFAAGSAGALNQWIEREVDKRMVRTRTRPLPSGAVSPNAALIFGLVLGILGVGLIWFGTNPLAASLTFATLLSYLAVYTPLKQITQWNTLIGAIPGALPPLIGWAAAEGSLGPLGWVLFGILFFWQIPHFMAIAWTYRKDYADGGFVMATTLEPTGKSAAAQSVAHALALLIISLAPVYFGDTSWFCYGIVAVGSGSYFLYKALRFWKSPSKDTVARQLFFASIFYLPLVLAALVVDRLFFVS